ncbi:MAG: type III polyketide synthase [Sporichthyaceae bacterium]|nr:type III polyketide synthase [Sporichthyaceae bacterium]
MTRIVAAAPALPAHRYEQQVITDAFAGVVLPDGGDRRLLNSLHEATSVRHRHLALPLEQYAGLDGFGAANDVFIRVGTELGEQAIRTALDAVQLDPVDVDIVMTTSVTGVAAPSLDARLVPRLGLRPDVRRIPMFGLGCVAGAAGLARLHDLLLGDPDAVAVLLSVELCSLTLQRDDASTANLVASGLFGDGAGAVVLLGEQRAAALGLAGPQVVATRSRFYPDTERVMGWDIGGSGFRIVLSASVADVVEENLGHDMTTFLGDNDLKVDDVVTWLAHPGGPKVLNAMIRTLGLPAGALDRTWRSLADVGNLSSASVLHVLAAAMAEPPPPPGSPGVLLAMGPGFCSELVLVRW